MSGNTFVRLDPQVVKIMRIKENHTQESLASEIGISTRQIKRIEKGSSTKLSTAKVLGNALGISLEQLQGYQKIEKHMPYYWCKRYDLKNGNWIEDTLEKAGRIFDHYNFLILHINEELNQLPTDKYSPCTYKVSAKLNRDQENNKFIFNIKLSYPRSYDSWEYEFKFEIRPFRFDESGMKWSTYCPLEADNLAFWFDFGFEKTVTDYISDEVPEVNDPYYCVELFPQELNQETAKYLWDRKASFFKHETNWLYGKATIANLLSRCENAASAEEEYETQEEFERFLQQYPACRPMGPYYFDTIKQVKQFTQGVIKQYQPEEIERSSAIKLIPKASSAKSCREVVINITRVSKSQDKTLPWPERHRNSFLDSLCEYANNLDSDAPSLNISLENLNDIAEKMEILNENGQ